MRQNKSLDNHKQVRHTGRVNKILATVLALVFLPVVAFCDPINPFAYVSQVTQNDGDTITTTQVSAGVCPGTSCPTLLSAAQTGSLNGANKTNRRRCFENLGSTAVFVGTNTITLTSVGYKIGESTSTLSTYCTYDTAAIYGTSTALSSSTIAVIQEFNTAP